jgi:branched-subunit amino acid ABC-type transport system permease component
MSQWLVYLLIGTGSGAVYAAIAMGTILTYRGSGVVNFAQGAMATYPALVYIELRDNGNLVLPILPWHHRIHLGGPMSFWPAFLLAVGVAAAMGYLIDVLIFRRLATATHVTKVIASVGLNIALFGLAYLQFGLDSKTAKSILPSGTIKISGATVPYDRFWFVGLAITVGGLLWAVFRWTKFGIATRASAENQKGAELMGLSPRLLSSLNWVLAAVIAGAAGILAAPVRGVTLTGFGSYLAFGLAAALAARLRSFSVATIVGVSLGMFEALSVHLKATGKVPSFLQGGFDTAVPFVVIVGALLIFGTNLPTRGLILDDRNPLSPTPRFNPYVLVPSIGLAVYVLGFGRSGLRLALIQSLIVSVLTLALVLMAGFVGQVTLAEVTFAGIGAFLLARFTNSAHLPFPLGPLVAILGTTIIATLISAPAVRIRGLQFAIVTFSGAVALEQLLFENVKFTGGAAAKVPAPKLFGKPFGIGSGKPGGHDVYPYKWFGFFVLIVAVLSALLVTNVRRGSVGRRMLAVRANERAAAAAGIRVPRTKLLGAAIGSFVAATAGVLWAYSFQTFDASSFPSAMALAIIAFAYIGGIAMVSGAFVAGLLTSSGFIFTLLSKQGGSPPKWQTFAAGVGMIVVAIKYPGGIASAGPALRAFVSRRRRRHDRAPSATTDGITA